MSKTFFDELYITALMAAPSVGRRSCAGQREAAALISQSRRWLYRRVKGAAARRLFSFAVVRQQALIPIVIKLFHDLSDAKPIQN